MKLNSIFYLHPLKFMKSISFFLLSVWKWWSFCHFLLLCRCSWRWLHQCQLRRRVPPTGRLHRHPRAHARHVLWLLENGVGTTHSEYHHDHQTWGEIQGESTKSYKYRPHSSHVQSYISRQKHIYNLCSKI